MDIEPGTSLEAILKEILNSHFITFQLTKSSERYGCIVVLCTGAGAGVLTYFQYFARAGAGSPPAALICAANYCRISAKKL